MLDVSVQLAPPYDGHHLIVVYEDVINLLLCLIYSRIKLNSRIL